MTRDQIAQAIRLARLHGCRFVLIRVENDRPSEPPPRPAVVDTTGEFVSENVIPFRRAS